MRQVSIGDITQLALKAGQAIMEYYVKAEDAIEYKSDASPLTAADKASHRIIEEGLRESYEGIPCISEENTLPEYAVRKDWEWFWLVDPLDGTKEFIKRTDEFTVNIALIHGSKPVLGVIYAPAKDLFYFAGLYEGAWRQMGSRDPESIRVRDAASLDGIVVVASRSHRSTEDAELLSCFKIRDETSIGSSLKFCIVADGSADLYPRMAPTWEWDTAAGQCILEVAGGRVVDSRGMAIAYNKPIMKNTHFIASAGFVSIPDVGEPASGKA